MRRNTDLSIRFPGYYRQDFLIKRREQLGLSVKEVHRRSGVPFDSTRRVFLGEASSKIVFPIAEFLGMDWSRLHDLDLPESKFHLAVNGGKAG